MIFIITLYSIISYYVHTKRHEIKRVIRKLLWLDGWSGSLVISWSFQAIEWKWKSIDHAMHKMSIWDPSRTSKRSIFCYLYDEKVRNLDATAAQKLLDHHWFPSVAMGSKLDRRLSSQIQTAGLSPVSFRSHQIKVKMAAQNIAGPLIVFAVFCFIIAFAVVIIRNNQTTTSVVTSRAIAPTPQPVVYIHQPSPQPQVFVQPAPSPQVFVQQPPSPVYVASPSQPPVYQQY